MVFILQMLDIPVFQVLESSARRPVKAIVGLARRLEPGVYKRYKRNYESHLMMSKSAFQSLYK
jgi:hypothetical protein